MRLDDFFAKIFRGVGFEEAPVIAIHKGNDYWETRRWRPGSTPPTGRLYFCISTVHPGHPRAQILKRRADDLKLTYVIVLDDVGTKVPEKLIKLQPSYKLETSPGNFQWGYLLTYGSDPAKAAALIEGLALAGLTDAGAKRADRVVRVPGSLNDKYAEPFYTRLVEEHWERTWTLSELELGFKVMAAEPRPAMDHIRALEAGETDPVFEWLVDDDRVLEGPGPRGWYRIACPWEAEHTSGDKGTDYAPGRPGAFSCLHGHCQAKGRNTAALKAWIKERDPDAVLERSMADVTAPLVAKLTATPAGATPAAKRSADVLAGLAEQAKAWRLTQEARQPDEPVEAPEVVEEAILRDLIHVASENRYWSVEIGTLLVHKAVNDHLRRRMFLAGLLDYEVTSATGKVTEKTMEPDRWLGMHDEVIRAGKLVHRLGKPLIVDGDLNIAPELPEDLTDVMGDPQPWLDVVDFICGDEDTAERVLDWMAMVVGTFKAKPGWHLLLKGRQGTGKNLMLLPLVRYLKPHHQADVSPKVLTGDFTTFLEKRLCNIDEMKTTTRGSSTGHDVYNTLKAYTAIGAETISVRAMYKAPYEASNLSCWCLTSNETVPLPIEDDDRRFMVIETPPEPMPKDWYQERGKWIESDGTEIVIGYLQRRWDEMSAEHRDDLRGRAPMTQAKQDLIDSGASGIYGAIRFMIRDGELPDLVTASDLMAKLAVTKHLPTGLGGQLTINRATDALKENGARKVKGGESIRGEGATMRLWCVRGDKLAEYDALDHQGIRAAYAAQSGRSVLAGQKIVQFPSSPHRTPH